MNEIRQTLSSFPLRNELLALIKPFKAVIFDMDGTLLNTENIHAHAIVSILPKQSVTFTKEEIEKHFHGMNDRAVFHKLVELGVKVPYSVAEEFVEAKNQCMVKLIQENKAVLNGVLAPNILDGLALIKAENKKLMLVTASETVVTETLLKALDLNHLFDEVITATNTHFTKPCASPYFLAMRLAETKCQENLIFEDSMTGLSAALESGAHVIKVSWFH